MGMMPVEFDRCDGDRLRALGDHALDRVDLAGERALLGRARQR